MALSPTLVARIEKWLDGKPTGSLTLDVKEGRVMKQHIHEWWPDQDSCAVVDKPKP